MSKKVQVTDDIQNWQVKNPEEGNIFMELLAEKYLDPDGRFIQGENEEIALQHTDEHIRLVVTRTYKKGGAETLG